MATQALIKINGTNAPDAAHIDLPINALVQLANAGLGGESTWAWEIIDQPPGAVVALSSAAIAAPTFTPTKEGTYLLELVVNAGLATEKTHRAVAAVLQLKSLERVPAGGEELEANATTGWASAVGSMMRRLDAMVADSGTVIGVAGAAGLERGHNVRITGVATIKAGLPGEELVPSFTIALATDMENVDEAIGIIEGGVDGDSSPASGDLIVVRLSGLFGPDTLALGGVPAVGTPVHLPDSGELFTGADSSVVRRQIGTVAKAVDLGGGNISLTVWYDGSLKAAAQSFDWIEFAGLAGEPNNAGPDGARLAAVAGVLKASVDEGDYFEVVRCQRGVATLVGGTATVNSVTILTATSRIEVSHNTPGGTPGILSAPAASRNVGASTFVINSISALDTSTVDWVVFG